MRHRKRSEASRAAYDEAERRYEALFGKPWNATQVADWKDWLARSVPVDAAAYDVVQKLTAALDAARRFHTEHPVQPVERREKREGLRVNASTSMQEVTMQLFVDPATLPADAPEELRGCADLLRTERIPATRLLLGGYEVHVSPATSGAVGQAPPFTLRYTIDPPDGGGLALFLRLFVHGAIEELAAHMDRIRVLLDMSKRLPRWASRVAVVAIFDRAYAPGELRERSRDNAQPDRLTPSELAVASILWGNPTNMPQDARGWTAADVIDQEAKHIALARDTLEAWRAAGFPIPRAQATGRVVQVDDLPGQTGDLPSPVEVR